ncbi:hypothetical protein Rhe02_63480 [Rhizocola hellebori]|uniref:Uncharacterized protein n=1 Tax=Rhizocola hellebori TaxID=1392758 RepID=A0A8J3QCV0_9ACTN|nr:hypothetical protein [Rhizocola hellebori]GIH08281.1 hypothetical protein Rhe02_63480 [Rhizocola hellebori]
MVDIAAAVQGFPEAAPLAGLSGAWKWSAGRFHFALALSPEGDRAFQLNCRGTWEPDLAIAVLTFARAHSETVLAAAPLAVVEGFASPTATPFDVVGAAIPAVHRYLEFDNAELNEVCYAVFPGYRCEFSGLETQPEAVYRFDSMLDPANLQRQPSPWVRMRFDNPKTGAGSIGSELGIASAEILLRELRDLELADGAFIELENFRGETRRVLWSGALQLENGDETRVMQMAELLAWAHRFVYEGIDSAT